MEKPELLKKLDGMIDEIARTHAWANVEIEFREGQPNMIRTTKNEKLTQENTRAHRFQR